MGSLGGSNELNCDASHTWERSPDDLVFCVSWSQVRLEVLQFTSSQVIIRLLVSRPPFMETKSGPQAGGISIT